ncbi:calcium-binding protein [Mumia zhuanghuii]|uniref:Calcium-binding protein n=1 Tax=Mumia zhuanghuii TaxID=2585211 RepID=A0A5C4MNQ7_9ACTN|nr:calcium-binding protein [Mumia zhuanghuii]TNC45210.1 calcium-binding protein [Mumia zhuanghuii]
MSTRRTACSAAALTLGLTLAVQPFAASPTVAAPTDSVLSTFAMGNLDVVQVKAGPGVANKYLITTTGLWFVLFKDASNVPFATSDDDCYLGVLASPTCAFTTYPNMHINVQAGDMNDSVTVAAQPEFDALLNGGPGNDTLRSTGKGYSYFYGGDGADTVTFEGLSIPVRATIDGNFDDGPTGSEPGYINADVENLTGGSANDVLRGGPAVLGMLKGGPGADTMYAGPAGSALFGGTGNDTLVGGAGVDFLAGEAGADTLYGGAGDDHIYVDDGAPGDTITCGAGNDTVTLDAGDTLRDPQSCERVFMD